MNLLGNYPSNLIAYLYQQLLAQLQANIALGEYSAGSLFDTAAAEAIQAQGQTFTSLTVPTAGDTAYADDINTPLNVLQARYAAIANEISELQTTISALLVLISKESSLIDQILGAGELSAWTNSIPSLFGATKYGWSFAIGSGIISTTYPNNATTIDPLNSVSYPLIVSQVSNVLNESLGGNGIIIEGIAPPQVVNAPIIKNLVWSFTPSSNTIFTEIIGTDLSWATLSTVEPYPLIIFGSPVINVSQPIGGTVNGIFTASGNVSGGSLPIYVRVLFYPRQNILPVTVAATANQNIQLSIYNIIANTVQVYSTTNVFVLNTDYTVNDTSVLTVIPTGGLVGQTFSILFTEYYPAYQCSIDQINWSPIIMLDPARPYPDNTTIFTPIEIKNGNFPLTDELGNSVGMYINKIGIPTQEFLLQVISPGSTTYGETAQLTATLEKTAYLNAVTLAPVNNFPITITNVTVVGFVDTAVSTILDIPLVLDREVTLCFPTQLVKQFVFTFYQKNYSIKEYLVTDPDSLRINTLAQLQSIVPFAAQRIPPKPPQVVEGVEYDIGISNIMAANVIPQLPGVFVSGPYRITGYPELIKLDIDSINMSFTSDVSSGAFLGYISYNANDQILASAEIPMQAGGTIPYTDTNIPDHVDFYIKFVLRNPYSIVKRFLLQVNTQ